LLVPAIKATKHDPFCEPGNTVSVERAEEQPASRETETCSFLDKQDDLGSNYWTNEATG
jgi:hypothetical protein